MSKSARGFTLIELLVVISIIAILSTVGLVAYSGVQKQARTAKRIADLKAIQTSLEMYYSVHKAYPVVTLTNEWSSECTLWGEKSPDDVITGLTPQYLLAMPSDPSMDKTNGYSCYLYTSDADGVDYKIMDYRIREFTDTDYKSQPNLVDPNRDSSGSINTGHDPTECDGTTGTAAIKGWSIYTYGARCW